MFDSERKDAQAVLDQYPDTLGCRGEILRCAELVIGMADAIERGGWDVSPCMECGLDVVCLPDGLPMCESCAGQAAR